MRAGSNLMDVITRTASDSNLQKNFEYLDMNTNLNTLNEESSRDCKISLLFCLIEGQ